MADSVVEPDDFDEADIAIIGMAGRFPGAASADALWTNVRDGVEAIRFLSEEECRAAGVPEAVLADPSYVRAAAILDQPEGFDAALFDIPAREAELTDPQHRAFLECAWEALEHAGYAPRELPGAVGVFGGATINTYLLLNLARSAQAQAVDPVQINIGNGNDFLTTRVAYKLNLRGASHSVQSACSTSLVAIHLACQSILNGECDAALAGGVSINVSQFHGYRYVEGGMTSPDGHCRPFDARAQGTLFGSGVGVVVLKRLRDAARDGDHVLAVIKGSAINNDGSLKAGYTAPGVEGQANVIAEALASAGVTADEIGLIEAHGTATPLGDPIEVQALTRAFRAGTERRRFCALGSIKGNVGHLDAAAGVTGLIKAVQALRHRQLPPSLHFTSPNPALDLDSTPFFVNASLRPWAEGPRRAGVSSFGVGGTNAHVVLEEAPALPASGPSSRPWQVLPVSAKSPAALDAATARLAEWLRAHPDAPLADVAWTLQVGRQRLPHRRVVVCRDVAGAIAQLDPVRAPPEAETLVDRPVAFLFPGQGTQQVNMGRDLYEGEPVFRSEVDRACALLTPRLGFDLRTVLYPRAGDEAACTEKLAQTAVTQPALFVVEHALARLWMSWGVKPDAMLGHSIGEYVAACLAGVFSLEDALVLVAERGRLMQGLPSGGMLAVPLPEDEVQPYLHGALSLAALNGPMQCVLSGTHEAIEAVRAKLGEDGVRCQPLVTSHAFHSSMMDPILEAFTRAVAAARPRPPELPFVSNVTGTWITPADAVRPGYWAQHLRQAVRFHHGLSALLAEPKRALLEVGPGQVLSRLARRHPEHSAGRVVLASLPGVVAGEAPASGPPPVLETLGRLWQTGAPVSWAGFHAGERRKRIPLPTYPFERKRYWIEPSPAVEAAAPTAELPETQAPVEEWLYLPSWRRAPRLASTAGLSGQRWLVFVDAVGLGVTLAEQLRAAGAEVTEVRSGSGFAEESPGRFTVAPASTADHAALLRALAQRGAAPGAIAHLWSVTAEPVSLSPAAFDQAQALGSHALLALFHAAAEVDPDSARRLFWITSHAHDVTGGEALAPEKAPALGLCKVIPQENPALACWAIDVLPSSEASTSLASQLLAELRAPSPDAVIALRGPHRWAPRFERAELSPAPTTSLRENGVYLVTGGTVSAGRVMAEGLARLPGAKVICVEPPGLPERAGWDAWLAQHPEDDPFSRRIRGAQALETAGAKVELLAVDLSSVDAVRAAIDSVIARHGALHGVLHAAMPEPARIMLPLSSIGPAELAWHFERKAHGLLALDQVLAGRTLDFRLLLSSLAPALGGLGGGALAAGCAFLDAFAQRSASGWVSIGWESWRLGGEWTHAGARGAAIDRLALTPEQGGDALRRLLALPLMGHVAICTSDLAARWSRWVLPSHAKPRATTESPDGAPVRDVSALHPRPALKTLYAAPTNDFERNLVDLWQQALGVAPIGTQDNFFELGGDSLIAVQISDRLKRSLGIAVPATTLYEGLTVQALSRLLRPELAPTTGAQAADDEQARDQAVQRRKQSLGKQRARRRDEPEDDDA